MVGKSQIKFIKSLQQKKIRNQHKLFVVEGKKTIQELINSKIEVYKLYSTDLDFINNNDFTELITATDLKRVSTLSTPNGYLGIFKIPMFESVAVNDWVVALDTVQDPGNLGTIIRLCDWFGIKNIICTKDTVDCFNPKVLQATMGSIARVTISYIDLIEFFKKSDAPIYGTFMDGVSIYTAKLPKKGIIIMGNEANGISEEISQIVKNKISIPQFGEKTTESLNVATATAILLNEIRRN